MNRNTAVAVRGAFCLTIFISAFLLFQVQPLFGRFILPWFGGSPAVWTTCMLVFQTLLFAGYAYAHASTTWLPPRRQAALHIGLLLLAMIMLPIYPNPEWKPASADGPALHIILLTMYCVGLPYFLVSSTGPLLQAWFSRTLTGESPYRLYALSNIGSLLGLVSYPFVVEPLLPTGAQALLWSGLFVIFALACSTSAVVMVRSAAGNRQAASEPVDGSSAASAGEQAAAPSWSLRALWFALAMTPSVMLLATTNEVCQDVAVIPFLWVAPLTIYLLTFILSFDSDRWYSRRLCAGGAAIATMLVFPLLSRQPNVPILAQVAVYFLALFFICMVCHRELALLKPHPRYLTGFYLTMAAGGAAGGLFVGLAAPRLFTSYHELHLAFIAFFMLYLAIRIREDGTRLPLPNWALSLAAAGLLVAISLVLPTITEGQTGVLEKSRNFYGILRVREQAGPDVPAPQIQLVNGRILHGTQFSQPGKRHIPTTYYGEQSGVGRLLRAFHVGQPRKIGVIGLGAGTLAVYGTAQDELRFYELIPDVITFAKKHFTFLSDSAARVTVVPGDARLLLEHESSQGFDILVLDAFSGDAVPVHLLTKEAMAQYVRHLKPDGVLACHISNLHFDLQPVMAGLAQEFGFHYKIVRSLPDPQTATNPAVWCILARDPEVLRRLFAEADSASPPARKPLLWTDERSNLLDVL